MPTFGARKMLAFDFLQQHDSLKLYMSRHRNEAPNLILPM